MKNGPIIEVDRTEWYLNDEWHREDGPAREFFNGGKEWWQNNKRHRVNGPAVDYSDGFRSWWLNGILHRANGPAIEDTNGHKRWFIHGKEINCKTQEEFEHLMRLKAFW